MFNASNDKKVCVEFLEHAFYKFHALFLCTTIFFAYFCTTQQKYSK